MHSKPTAKETKKAQHSLINRKYKQEKKKGLPKAQSEQAKQRSEAERNAVRSRRERSGFKWTGKYYPVHFPFMYLNPLIYQHFSQIRPSPISRICIQQCIFVLDVMNQKGLYFFKYNPF